MWLARGLKERQMRGQQESRKMSFQVKSKLITEKF